MKLADSQRTDLQSTLLEQQIPPAIPDARRTTTLGAAALANLAIGLLLQWKILTDLGAGTETDALYAAFIVPNLLVAVLMTPLTQVLVPLLAVEPRDTLARVTWTLLAAVGGFFGCAALLLITTADAWVPWTVPGFTPENTGLTVELLRVQSIAIVCSPMSLVLWSAYQARGQFLLVEVNGILAGLASFTLMWLTLPTLGVAGAAAALALRPTLQMLTLIGGLGYPLSPNWSLTTIRETWRRTSPLVLASAYWRTEIAVNRFLASLSSSGSITLLHMAQMIYAAGDTIIGKALVRTIVPTLATQVHRGDWEGARRLVMRRVVLLLAATTAALAALTALGRPLLELIFGWGRLQASEVAELWVLLLALGGRFIGRSATAALSSAFFACGNVSAPLWTGNISYTVTLPIRIMFFHWWGLIGLGIAISVEAVLQAAGLAYALFWHHNTFREHTQNSEFD